MTTPHPEFQGQNPQQPSEQPQQSSQTPSPPPYQQPPVGQFQPGQPTAQAQQVLEPQQQRTWGMLSHLIPLIAMVLSGGFLGFVGSLIIYVMYKERGDFVRKHAANSVNVQIMTGILIVLSWPLILVFGLGFVTWGIVIVWAFVLHIIGALRANEGQQWTPPMTPQFVK